MVETSNWPEPCPFCGVRIIPIKVEGFKVCTVCGGRWFESGGSGIKHRYYPPEDGGAGISTLQSLPSERRRRTLRRTEQELDITLI